jgi:hypothetical protein
MCMCARVCVFIYVLILLLSGHNLIKQFETNFLNNKDLIVLSDKITF